MARTSPIYIPIVGSDELSKKLATIQKRVANFGSGMKKIGGKLTKAVTVPLGLAGLASMKFARDLNESMANVATLIPGQSGKILELKKSVQDLSIETGKNTGDIAEGLYEVVSAFGDSAESVGRLDIAVKAGIAGRAETIESFKLLAAQTKGFGESSVEAMRKAADLDFYVVKLGQTTFPELARGMKDVTSFASTFSKNQEELTAVFATATGITGGASEVATQLKGIYKTALKPTTELSKAVKKFGFDSAAAAMETLGLWRYLKLIKVASLGGKDKVKALKDLGFSSLETAKKSLGLAEVLDRVAGSTDLNKASIGRLVPEAEAQNLTLALLGKSYDNYEDKLKKAYNVTGLMTSAYKEQTQGINKAGADWNKFIARLQVFAQRLGDKLLPIAKKFFKIITPLLEKLEKMDDATLEWGIKLAGLAMTIGPALRVTGNFVGSLANIMGMIGKTKGGLKMLSSSFTALTGSAGKSLSLLSKISTVLGSIGAVGAAGLAGAGIGTLISETLLEPQAEEQAAQRERVDIVRRQTIEIARTGTKEEKLAQLGKLQAAAMELPKSFASLETAAGFAASIFTDIESPLERTKRQTQEIVDAQQMLIDSIKKDTETQKTITKNITEKLETKQVVEKREITKELIQLDITGGEGRVNVRRQKTGRTGLDTGKALQGAR